MKWPTKYDDMFPYADNEFSYWTGFYTSYPNLKLKIRGLSSWFHSATSLFADKALDVNVKEETLYEMNHAKENILD